MNTLTQMGWIQSNSTVARKATKNVFQKLKGSNKCVKKGSTKKVFQKTKKRKVCNQLPSKPSYSKCGNEYIQSTGNAKEAFMKLFAKKSKNIKQTKLPDKCETCITYPVYLNGKCRMCLHL